MKNLKRYALHILYVLTATQVGTDQHIVATRVLEECDKSTIDWTITPATPFVYGGDHIVILSPAPGTYEVYAEGQVSRCQGLLYLVIVPEPATGARMR